jgi:hypothetical protein
MLIELGTGARAKLARFVEVYVDRHDLTVAWRRPAGGIGPVPSITPSTQRPVLR